MDLREWAAIVTVGFLPSAVLAGNIDYDYQGRIRGITGHNYISQKYRNGQDKSRLIGYGEIGNAVTYHIDGSTFFKMNIKAMAQSGTYLDNLNQGQWGEEIYGLFQTTFGDFYFGQMPNVAAQLGINRPNMPSWQPSHNDIVNFIHNPNWQQKKHRKYYNTLNSTLIDTDGSSLKVSYITPEFMGTAVGFTYTPKNNANDGLISKFAPYSRQDAYIATVYHSHQFNHFDAEAYVSFADYRQSHYEYAGGLSFYRKGWTLFASYRQTDTTKDDFPIATKALSANMPAYFDGFRRGKAWNAGIGYEQAFLTSTLTYFKSQSDYNDAQNTIIGFHNSISPFKNYSFYISLAYVDFKSNYDNLVNGNQGTVVFGGVEINF